MSLPPPVGPPIEQFVDEHAGTSADIQLAGFWRRFAGLVLDQILYGALAAVFVAAGLGLIAARNCYPSNGSFECYEELVEPWSALAGIAIIALGALFVLYLYLRALGRTGQPWGARLVGIKVIRADDGSSIGFGRALGRTLFANIISANVLYLGYLWMLWDDRKQTWQDKVVRSIVVRV